MKKVIAGAFGAFVMVSATTASAADIALCLSCHNAGTAGAPFSNASGKADWEKRLKENGGDVNAWVATIKAGKTKSGGAERALNPTMVPMGALVTADKVKALMATAGVK